ncbi:nicotinamidase [Pseudomonas aeruginosa]
MDEAILPKTGPRVGQDAVLIVVDVQNCFIDGGSLPVPKGEQVVPVINKLGKIFDNVIVTQDWHTPGHVSFASSHPGKKPFDTTSLPYGQQMLWPDHCLQGTTDAELVKSLDLPQAQLIIRKGYHHHTDSYSAFVEADKKTLTGLGGYIKERGIRKVYVTGLATDFCVARTALDARKQGFEVYVVEDAARGIDVNGSLAAAWEKLLGAGVKRIQSSDLM